MPVKLDNKRREPGILFVSLPICSLDLHNGGYEVIVVFQVNSMSLTLFKKGNVMLTR